jgi:putative membrane protein insertion efficiency factor
MMRRLLIVLVKGYRLLLSPWLGASCRFEPTCSVYAIEALERHGAMVGSGLTLHRIARCQPWCDGGHDPVPTRDAGSRARGRLFPFLSSPSSDVSPDKKSSS